MRKILISAIAVGLLTACSSPSTTTTAPPETPAPSVSETTENDDLEILQTYITVIEEIQDISGDISGSSSGADTLTACVLMASAATEGLALDDLPWDEVNTYWDKSMASYVAAGSFCTAGDLEAAVEALADGAEAMVKATDAFPVS